MPSQELFQEHAISRITPDAKEGRNFTTGCKTLPPGAIREGHRESAGANLGLERFWPAPQPTSAHSPWQAGHVKQVTHNTWPGVVGSGRHFFLH